MKELLGRPPGPDLERRPHLLSGERILGAGWAAKRGLGFLVCLGALLACSSQEGAGSDAGVGSLGGADGAGADGGGARAGTGSTSGGGGSNQGPFAIQSLARRLSRAELDNTLRDVFGDDSRPASIRLNEDSFDPFDNNYELQSASAALIDSLELLAEEVAGRVLGDAETRARLVPCEPSTVSDEACFRQVAEHLGELSFRRPLSEEEVASYVPLLAFAEEKSDFFVAVDLLIRSLIQDPEFLYRIEVGSPSGGSGVSALDSYEIATRLSYLLWGSAPDEALLSDAVEGNLTDPASRRQVAARMLEDERSRAQLHRYHAMWLGYRAIPHEASLVQDFNRETTALLDRVIFEDEASYLDLFTTEQTYVTSSLASHYGLPEPDGGEGWVDYGSDRAGILSHGSVLSAFSKFSDTSPTQRGIFVQTRLLCNQIEPPPANVDVDQPPGDDEAACKIDRYAQHREIQSCAACHQLLDPVGLGLENYDMAGVFREHDDGNPDCLIDGEGQLPSVGTFSGPKELGRMLADGSDLDSCAVEHYLTFALGRGLTDGDEELAASLTEDFRAKSHDFKELILSLVEDEAFGLRREGP